MPRRLAVSSLFVLAVVAAAIPPNAIRGDGPKEAPLRYAIERPENVFVSTRPLNGRNTLFVTLQFRILNAADKRLATDIAKDEIRVEEDGVPVTSLEITSPAAEPLTTVLALDISGSMDAAGKWPQAREAAHTFLDRLDRRSDTGLILFDHLLREQEPPAASPADYTAHRDKVRRLVDAAKPGGGTSYIDAAARGVEMLKGVEGRRAVVLMTDGVDMNSKRRLDEVIKMADVAKVPVYTLGIGEPGKNETVTTILVLDKSGSMSEKANTRDNMTKIEALRTAASRFVDLMRPKARTMLLPFSTEVDKPGQFTADREELKHVIAGLNPDGGTALYDAAYVGVETLTAARVEGRKALVVLTDGQDEDPGSSHSDADVIEAAKRSGVALYMMGLGRPQEINEPVMRRMAKETGGEYFHAGDPGQLIDIFESLCIKLHDDGIDEESLRKLADRTGGRYVPARDVSKLSELFGSIADELQSTYTVTFPSHRPSHDGTARGIEVRVVRAGKDVSDVASTGYQLHGVVVPEMDAGVYLLFLGLLVGMLGVPSVIRRLKRPPEKLNAS
jgi:VWFA-related protein